MNDDPSRFGAEDLLGVDLEEMRRIRRAAGERLSGL
jgi:hypothetical protein